ncbi:MAG: L-aspartate oxidase [Candidatus Omnitrophica bacterium]|nr:L-aspartate oxidase [Candidatus Omnitrophota bacterium]
MIPEYLVSFSPDALPSEEVDCLIIGCGIAGLRAAVELDGLKVLIACKNDPFDGCTYHAQGGIAAALLPPDSPEIHFSDTINAGCFLNDEEATRILVNEGVERVKELIDWGCKFDKKGKNLDFTKEAAHSFPRILHARGDATGKEIIHALLTKIGQIPGIILRGKFFLIDLVCEDETVKGGLFYDIASESLLIVKAKKVIVASGGSGQIYQETTNPVTITGDLQAAAFRKGALLGDMEFYQFHPTTLYMAGVPRFLISESVRGEGAILVNVYGERFMRNYHPDMELAPRDVVSRAIVCEMRRTNSNCVYLDMRKLKSDFIISRFPQIYNFCLKYGLDITKDLIPVRPSAHYAMGGIVTDIFGKTILENLFACGEVACTGVHGANRLASNSLLEGLVFGARAGKKARDEISTMKKDSHSKISSFRVKKHNGPFIDIYDLQRSIKSLMWRNVGIERDAGSLGEAMQKLDAWGKYIFLNEFFSPTGWEVQNMFILSLVMTHAALSRQESRGAHFRKDFPEPNEKWKKRQMFNKHFFNSLKERK